MPPHKRPRNLKTLCIEFISLDISQHKDQIPLISRLPASLLDEIHEYVLDHYDVQEHTCVERLGCKLKLMNLSQLRWVGRSAPRNPQPVNVRLFEQCKYLTDIGLSMNLLDTSDWKRLFCAISHVHKLQVNGTNVTDECLTLLGDRCPDLQDLNLSGCEHITDTGMLNLIQCKPHGEWTCSKLSTLDVVSTRVDTEGARHVLLHAKVLRYFHFPRLCQLIHRLSWRAQQAGAEPLRLCLTSLVLRQDQEYSSEQATSCIQSCPHLTELEIFSEGIEGNVNYNYMQHLPGLRKLSVFAQVDDDISFSEVLLPALPCLTSTLVSLQLTEIQGLSLTVLGRNCPGLKKLELGLSSRSLSNADKPLKGEVLFPNLEELFVFREDPGIFDAESLGILLFNCHKLESLLVCCLQCLDDNFVTAWISHNPLSAFEYLEIALEHRLSQTGLWKLMHHCSNLKNLVVPPSFFLARHAILRLNRKAQEQMWDIKISEDESDIGRLLGAL